MQAMHSRHAGRLGGTHADVAVLHDGAPGTPHTTQHEKKKNISKVCKKLKTVQNTVN
jgi:hypothetical protein